MFLRGHLGRKDGKEHRYFSIEESRRLSSGKTVQRRVLYLGEINDSQQAAWRKSLEVFDEAGQRYTTLSLFPEDRPGPVDAVDSLQVKLSEMQLRRPRAFGNCWLGCELWRQLRLDEFWRQKLSAGREAVHWAQVLELLAVNRLIDPGSEFRLHRQWFEQSAMDQLPGVDFVVAAKDRLYRCLDRLLPHRQELFTHLRRRWENLFEARFDLLLYDLTSTYVEGEAELIPKARHGYSRDGRFDCKQVVIAPVVTPEGFPLAYEVMAGNTSDRNSLRIFLEKIETMYGKARRVWMMDRGIPSEELLAEMRAPGREMFYLVGTPRGKIRQYEKKWLALPWNKVRDSVEVKLFADGEEMYVLAKSEGRQAKEMAIRRRKLARLLWKLRAMRRSLPIAEAVAHFHAILRAIGPWTLPNGRGSECGPVPSRAQRAPRQGAVVAQTVMSPCLATASSRGGTSSRGASATKNPAPRRLAGGAGEPSGHPPRTSCRRANPRIHRSRHSPGPGPYRLLRIWAAVVGRTA